MRQWSKFLFPLVLSTLSSCTFASYTDEELMQSLNQLAMRAISIFRFPRISLEYVIDEAGEGSFVNEITMNELEVVLSWHLPTLPLTDTAYDSAFQDCTLQQL